VKKVSLVVILGLVVLQVSVIEAKKAVSCVTRAPKVDRVKRNLTKKKLKNKRILMNYPYKLPELGYAFDALEPHIDKETMILHLTKHQQAYVNNLNAILENHPELQKRSLEDILSDLKSVPEAIRQGVINQGGGVLNHTMFWTMMSPQGGGEPTGEILEAIKANFGSYEAFKEQFTQTAKKLFGSGWVWLSVDKDGKLIMSTSPDQETPLSDGLKPVMCFDVWEHAYYLKYQNRRPEYIDAWWHVVDWDQINRNYIESKK
jgi:superoxide dismutase, Fe-Mn family